MKLSQRKISPVVDAAGSSSAASAASAGSAVRKKIRSPLAKSGIARRQDFIEPPHAGRRPDRKVLRREWYRQFRRPARRSTVRVALAPPPPPRPALSSPPATPVAQWSAPRSRQPGVPPALGGGPLPARQIFLRAPCAAIRYIRAAFPARLHGSLRLPAALPRHVCGVRRERARWARR